MRLALFVVVVCFGVFVEKGLAQDGHVVDWSRTGPDGLADLTSRTYDAAIVDVMLPGKSGFDVIRAARQRHVTTPIIVLSARNAVDDRISSERSAYARRYDAGAVVARLH